MKKQDKLLKRNTQGGFMGGIRTIRRDFIIYIMLLVFAVYYAFFIYKPMAGIVIAFKKYSLFRGIASSPWIGLENFKTFLSGPYFVRLLRNTFLIGIYGLIFVFP